VVGAVPVRGGRWHVERRALRPPLAGPEAEKEERRVKGEVGKHTAVGARGTDLGAAAGGADRLQGGALGTLDLVFFVVAAAAPLTVMAGVAPLAIRFGGLSAPSGYLLAGIVLAVFAVGFTAMSRHIQNAGAFYAYVAKGLGKPAGVGAALLALVAYSLVAIGLTGAFASFTSATVQDLLGLSTPWEIWAFSLIAILAWLGYRRVTFSAKVLGVALALEVAILLALAFPVLFQGGAEGFPSEPLDPRTIFSPGLGAMLVLAFGAFIGFEATAIYSEESRNPRRTVPRATYIAVAFLALFYTFITWTIIAAFGPERALVVAARDPEGMFFAAMADYVGRWASDVMRVLIVTSAFAATLAFHNAASRYFYALGRERVLPPLLGRTHPTTHSPWAGSFTQTALAVVVVGGFALAGADPYLQLFLWTSGPSILGLVVLWALCALAVVGFFRRGRQDATFWQRLVAPVLAFVGLGVASALIVANFDLLTGAGSTTNALLIGSVPVVFAIGVIRALWLRRKNPSAYEALTTTDVERG